MLTVSGLPTMEVIAHTYVRGRQIYREFGVAALRDQYVFSFLTGEDVASMTVDRAVFDGALAEARRTHATNPRSGLRRRRVLAREVVHTPQGVLGVIVEHGDRVTLESPFSLEATSRLRGTLYSRSHWTCLGFVLDEALVWARDTAA